MNKYRSWQKINHTQLVELLANNSSINACARFFQVELGTMQRYIIRHKLTVIYKVNRFTALQKRDIIQMVKKGIPLFYIAEIYSRSYDVMRVTIGRWGIKSNYHAEKRKSSGTWGKPVGNDELLSVSKKVRGYLKRKLPLLTDDELNDSINQAIIEMRWQPRHDAWFAAYCHIAYNRAVNLIRAKTGTDRGGKSNRKPIRIDLEDATPVERKCPNADYVDLVDEVSVLLEKLPSRMREIVKMKMTEPVETIAKKLKLSVSEVYRQLEEAYSMLRDSHSK